MRKLLVFFFCLSILGCSSNQTRTEPANDASVDLAEMEVVSPEHFLVYLNELEITLEQGKPRQLDEQEAAKVNRLSNELRSMLAGVDNIKTMSIDDQHEVFNATQELWATIHEVEPDRVVCRRQHRVGTHMKQTNCQTVTQARNDRNRWREFIRESYSSQWVPPDF